MKKFKVLMFDDIFVNEPILGNGIYATGIPEFYSVDETLESLAEKKRKFNSIVIPKQYSEEYFVNLSKCKLVEYSIEPITKQAASTEFLDRRIGKIVINFYGMNMVGQPYFKKLNENTLRLIYSKFFPIYSETDKSTNIFGDTIFYGLSPQFRVLNPNEKFRCTQ